jgi:lipopolysaccharide/colanic/teichoic acid biosynthesis glycosyltransferase
MPHLVELQDHQRTAHSDALSTPTGLRVGKYASGGKRIFDLLITLCLLVPATPVILLVMILVKLTSRGPALFRQTRLGLCGRPYTIFKVRTMTHNCEAATGAQWSTPGDPRVTWLGRLLRRTHLDELPQLWNILRGDMSLVGPRPERPEFFPTLSQAMPHYPERLRVRPGLTGLAQVQLPPDTDLQSVRRKLACDVVYVQQVSFWLDVRILMGTVLHVAGVSGRITRKLLGLPGGAQLEAPHGQTDSVLDEPRVEVSLQNV